MQATHVPYAQFPQAIADLVSGVNTYQFITVLPVVQLIETGKLKALAVTGHKRVPALKDVPTIAEAGYPKLAAEDWAGLLLKAGTPPTVIAQLNEAINKALKTDKVREALAARSAPIRAAARRRRSVRSYTARRRTGPRSSRKPASRSIHDSFRLPRDIDGPTRPTVGRWLGCRLVPAASEFINNIKCDCADAISAMRARL